MAYISCRKERGEVNVWYLYLGTRETCTCENWDIIGKKGVGEKGERC